MRVLVATSDVPFVEGGHRVIARALARALREAGHDAEILTTPQNRFGRQFTAYLANRVTDVELTGNGEPVDRLISLRFPSYALKHPNHVCWLLHRMREYYDLWPQWTSRLSWKGRIKEGIRRRFIHTADNYLLKRNVKKVFALSKTVQSSLERWGNIPSEVLYPPPPGKKYWTDSYDDFILSPARLTSLKRVHLLVHAMKGIRSGRAVLVGDGSQKHEISAFIKEHDLQQRVEIRGHVDEEELAQLYARCRGVFYAPVNEDFGMVTLEAFFSRKPVITATDSGGTMEVVRDQVNGLVVKPDVEAVQSAVDALLQNRAHAESLGNCGYEQWRSINWQDTVLKLLEQV